MKVRRNRSCSGTLRSIYW